MAEPVRYRFADRDACDFTLPVHSPDAEAAEDVCDNADDPSGHTFDPSAAVGLLL